MSVVRPSGRDVIVLGAGHNGLTAACYLAKAGLSVEVVEASPMIGGMTATYPSVPGAPDHLINQGAIQVSLFRASTIERDLDLARHGLRQVIADPQHVQLGYEGESLAIWADPRRTADEIRRFSRKDASAWLELARTLELGMDLMLPFMLANPTRPSAATLRRMLGGVVRHRRELAPLAKIMLASHAEAVDQYFENVLVRGALIEMASWDHPLRDGTGMALIYLGFVHRMNSSRFIDGTGALPAALERCLRAHGGSVRTRARVAEVLVRGGRCAGVRLQDGEELSARMVLSACNPKHTLNDLLPAGVLPDEVAIAARHIPTRSTKAAGVKINVALRGRLTLPRHQRWRSDDLDLRMPVTSWHTLEEHVAAWDEVIGGRWPDPLPAMAVIPTALDPSQAPDSQDTLWIWCGRTPAEPEEPWSDAVRQRVGQAVIGEHARFYEGIDEYEIGREVLLPCDLAERFNAIDGNVYHVDAVPQRFGARRPAQGVGGYATPIPGLYLTGAGTHPSAGICGIGGQLAAAKVLKDAPGIFEPITPSTSTPSPRPATVA